MHYYSMSPNCELMIMLYDPFNDRYGDFFAPLAASAYLSVVLLNTSHILRGKEHTFGGRKKKKRLQGSSWGFFF